MLSLLPMKPSASVPSSSLLAASHASVPSSSLLTTSHASVPSVSLLTASQDSSIIVFNWQSSHPHTLTVIHSQLDSFNLGYRYMVRNIIFFVSLSVTINENRLFNNSYLFLPFTAVPIIHKLLMNTLKLNCDLLTSNRFYCACCVLHLLLSG